MAEADMATEAVADPGGMIRRKRKERMFNRKTTPLYLMILPAFVLTLLFVYATIPGRLIAFTDWRIGGFQGWVGLAQFKYIFGLSYFWQSFLNTWRDVLLGYLFVFPAPIILAILLNEMRSKPLKSTVQTLTVLPNFINWVVIGGIFVNILSPRFGYVNYAIQLLGGKPIYFMSLPKLFPWLFTFMRDWKGVGYSAIIYLAALSGVDSDLYESAVIDGAGRIRQTFAVTLPAIAPTILVLFVLSFADVFGGLFQPILVLRNPMILSTAEVLDTYIYEVGLVNGDFAVGAAAGLFKATIGVTLVLIVNYASKRLTPDRRGIF